MASRQLLPATSIRPDVSRLGAGCRVALLQRPAVLLLRRRSSPPIERVYCGSLPIPGKLAVVVLRQMRPSANLALRRWPLLLILRLGLPRLQLLSLLLRLLHTALADPGGRVQRVTLWGLG